jgi:hypothetical protein
MALLMRNGVEPTKRQICDELGLDYDDGDDRAKVTQAIGRNRRLIHYAWQLWVESGDYDKHYQKVADLSQDFLGWKNQKAELCGAMKTLGMPESDIHQLWILSRLWEIFLTVANQWNLHIFVAFGTPWHRDGFKYRQPDYWDYIANQVETARRLCKGTLTILERHRDFGMILTSGTDVEIVVRTAKDTLQMIADGEPPRFSCEQCANQGIIVVFKTQKELIQHYNQSHVDSQSPQT